MNTSKLSRILNKQIAVTILVITIISALLGFIYNILQPNPLPLIYSPKHVETIDDSALFGKVDTIETNKPDNNNLQISQEAKKDTIQKVDAIISKDEITEKNIKDKQEPTLTTNPKELKSVNFEQMKKLVGNKDFIIIDARREDDFNKAHIPGAINLFALAEPNEKFEKIMSIPMGKKYVIYCDGGNCDLSHQLANELLNSFGFTNVFVYEGGWEEWSKKNN